jgi:hypothetical protein
MRILLLLFCLFTAPAFAQDDMYRDKTQSQPQAIAEADLTNQPIKTIEMRLKDGGNELYKAGHHFNYSVAAVAAGAIMSSLIMYVTDVREAAIGTGVVFGVAAISFRISGGIHLQRAGKMLYYDR